MAESSLCPFVKVRQGLNKANYYIMQTKKELVEILKQIFEAQQEENKAKNEDKKQSQKKDYKSKSNSNFNNFNQRPYSKEDLKSIQWKLLGWDKIKEE
jgi:RPA family protein